MYQATVRYGEMRYLGVFRTELDSIRRGDQLIVRSGRGVEVGLALTPSSPAPEIQAEEPAGEILRQAAEADVHQIRVLDELGKTQASRYVKEKIAEHKLPMKLSYVEHLFGGDRIVVYFKSDGRVDFRGLVRDLSAHFQTRIVMKQIGARDEARLLGDWNDCGRELCCRTHLQSLEPIPMKMAKSQKTTLDPAKISGRCGRLKCCLRYEHDTYVEFKKRLPRTGGKVRTRDGVGTVVASDVLAQLVMVELPSGARASFKASEVLPLEKGGTPGRPRGDGRKDSFYVTVPFFNIETPITIQAVYCGLAADTLARFCASSERNVQFLTGVKDHSRATQKTSDEESKLLGRGDRYQRLLADEWARLSISASQIFRTEADIHKKTVRDFFKKLRNNDDIYKTSFQGSHCVACHWSAPGERSRDTCPCCGGPVESIDEELYFFRLSKFQKRVLGHLKTHENFIKPKILKIEIEDRLKNPTGDVIVARSCFDYGIAIPDDEGVIVSGWFESLLSYVSALADGKKNPIFETFWPADVHLVTREHLWTHAAIWPSMLFAGEIPLPLQIVVAGDWTDAGGEPGQPETLLAGQVVERFGGESLRYHLLHDTPFGLSGTFRLEEFTKVVDRDLAGDLVQLVGRILSMVEKYFDSRVPTPAANHDPPEEIRAIVERLEREYASHMEALQFSIVLSMIWEALRALSAWLETAKPWKLARKDGESTELATILYDLLETMRLLAIYLSPLLPRTAERLLQKLGAGPTGGPFQDAWRWGLLPPGAAVDRQAPLFTKIEHPESESGTDEPSPPGAPISQDETS